MRVNFIKFVKEAVLPKKAHNTDACFDVVATSVKDLGDGRIEYGLGFGLQPLYQNQGIQFDFRPRSSIHKTGLMLSNCVGTGDEGYTGEYKAVFYNLIPSLPNYQVGDRILQMQVTRPVQVEFKLVEKLRETDRGDGGFGSTKGFTDNEQNEKQDAFGSGTSQGRGEEIQESSQTIEKKD